METVDTVLGEVRVHHVEHGRGVPLVALHGAGVDHRDVESALEAVVGVAGHRRIYPDLPGMGRTTSTGLHGNADVVALLAAFVESLGAGPVMLLGHSYGAYLARGVAARRPDLVRGLALLCPVAERATDVPPPVVVREDADAHDDLAPEDRAGFDEYFVVRTRATARRYRDHVAPGAALVDHGALAGIVAAWPLDVGSGSTTPTLVVAGRRDAVVGHVDASGLLDLYPRATLAVIEDAGHALMHERPDLLAALIGDWLDRARPSTA